MAKQTQQIITEQIRRRTADKILRLATTKTATANISHVNLASQSKQISDSQVIDQEITNRTVTNEPAQTSLITGQTRYKKEDENNLTTQIAITNAAKQIVDTRQAESQQTVDLTTSITPEDRISVLQSKTFVSKKARDDAIRANRKLQSNCNHKYNISTQRCEFCAKHRNSHVYDQT